MNDCHFFAAMVFVNLVTIFKVYCNITIIKGKGRKTLSYDFFSALDEIKGHYYIFSCFNVFFPILFFSPLKKTKQGSKCQRFGEKKILEHEWPRQAVQRSQCCVLVVSDRGRWHRVTNSFFN